MKKSLVYTKTGDKGTTGIADGSRLLKNAARIQAIGDVDELNCQLGLCESMVCYFVGKSKLSDRSVLYLYQKSVWSNIHLARRKVELD